MADCSQFHVNITELRRQKNENYYDICFIVGEEEFRCHRIVMASASPFINEFLKTTKPLQCLRALPMINAKTFEILLDFMYSSILPQIDAQNVHDLFRTSERFRVVEVSNHCYEYLRRNVGQLPIRHFENFAFTRDDWHSPKHLVDNVCDFIVGHFEVCVATDESFLQLPFRHLEYILKRYRQQSWTRFENENFLLNALIRWTRHVYGDREKHFEELVKAVDFGRVSNEWLAHLAKKYEIGWESDELSERELITSCLGLIDHDVDASNVEDEKAPLNLKSSTFHLLVGEYSGRENPCQGENLFETYRIFSKVKHNWPLSCEPFKRSSSRGCTCSHRTPAIMACAVLDEPNRLFCLEYDMEHVWPQLNVYDSLDALSAGSDREALARPPFPLSHRPSMNGLDKRSEMIFLFGNDEQVSGSRWDHARRHHPELSDERSYHQCSLYYRHDVDTWFTVPFRGNDVHSSCLVTSDDLVYLIGGQIRAGSPDTIDAGKCVQTYDHRSSTWQTLPPTKYSYHSIHSNANYAVGCVLNGEICVSDSTHMEIFSPTAGKWREVPHAIEQRFVLPNSHRKLLALEERLYLFHEERTNIVCQVLDPKIGEKWSAYTCNSFVRGGSFLNDIFVMNIKK